jgi:hypothetical protein
MIDLWLKQMFNLSLYQSLLIGLTLFLVFLVWSIDMAEEKEGD